MKCLIPDDKKVVAEMGGLSLLVHAKGATEAVYSSPVRRMLQVEQLKFRRGRFCPICVPYKLSVMMYVLTIQDRIRVRGGV